MAKGVCLLLMSQEQPLAREGEVVFSTREPSYNGTADEYQSLRNYCLKSGLNKGVLGLSGGIDSAVAACLLLGSWPMLTGFSLPSRHSSAHSTLLMQKPRPMHWGFIIKKFQSESLHRVQDLLRMASWGHLLLMRIFRARLGSHHHGICQCLRRNGNSNRQQV